MDAQGYRWVGWRVWLCRGGSVLTLGLLPLLFFWRPRLGVVARCSACPLALAEVLLLRGRLGHCYVVDVLTEEVEDGSVELVGEVDESREWRDTVQLHKEQKSLMRFYEFEGLRYVWLPRKGAFGPVSVLNEELERILNPFYVFQVFSIALWMADVYYYYASCILFILPCCPSASRCMKTRKQSVTLRGIAEMITTVTVRRSTEDVCVSSEELVPGDCLVIPPEGLLLPCDAALLAGECMVNESMLTGESVPVLKTPLPPTADCRYSSEGHRRHTLFCGTQLIQAKGGASAVVTSTGFSTAKGDLISSILYPQPINFRFYQDATSVLNEDWTCIDLHSFQGGLNPAEQKSRQQVYGPNLISVPVKSYMRLLVEEDAQGYRWVGWRVWLCRGGSVLTLGLLPLLFFWRPRLGVVARCSACPLALAEVLLLRGRLGHCYVVDVLTEEVEDGSVELVGEVDESREWRDTVQLHKEQKSLMRFYEFEGLRYVWLPRKGAFGPVSVLNEDWTCIDLHSFQGGLNPAEQKSRQQVYGPNLISVPVKSYMRLLVDEILNPFYVFQVFSIALWMADVYYYYASCILFISLLSISISLYETRKVSLFDSESAVSKTTPTGWDSGVPFLLDIDMQSVDKQMEHVCVSSEELVPGDCLVIPPEGLLLPCDAALLAGECMVNESMLTGESVPVLKTPLPPTADCRYSSEGHRRHTLFCGTQLIQAKGGASAVVTSTALLGTVYSLVMLSRSNVTWYQLVIRALDVVTIVVPPALPAAITTGTIYAQRRLKRQGVFCISPPRINVCGKVSLFCFDKTGTLTEEGLDMWGVMEAHQSGFSELVPDPRLLAPGPLLSALACCHSELIEPSGDGHTLHQEFGGHRVVSVMRPPAATVYSESSRMSVVAAPPGGRPPLAFIKGSPEMVTSLCLGDTVPPQFTSVLQEFASQGFRVLALGYKVLSDDTDLQTIE
ncbi:hypothetical protein CRUP_025258, partial [Coryphaenoides rupestris]